MTESKNGFSKTGEVADSSTTAKSNPESQDGARAGTWLTAETSKETIGKPEKKNQKTS